MISHSATTRRSSAGLVFLGATVAITLAMLASRASYVPTWDGRIYAECIVDAAVQRLSLDSLRCADHISQTYMLFAGAIQMLSPGSFPLMLLANAILYVVAIAGCYRLTTLAFPGDEHAVDRALLTSVVAAQPAMLASAVQPNIDFPMIPAFLWATVFIVQRRWLLVIALGAVLAATKESGVVLYVALVFSYAVAMVLPKSWSPRAHLRALLPLAPLAIPALLFAIYIGYRFVVPHETVIWSPGMSKKSIVLNFIVPRVNRVLVNYVAMIAILSFAWIMAAVIGADAVVAIKRTLRGQPERALPGAERHVVRFLVVLFVVTVYTLTRFLTWGNTRYLLPIFALTPFVFYAALVRFGVAHTVRRAAVGAMVVLSLISVVRTVDPVSRLFYGTWTFGDHSLLRMTRVTHECCGAGRDQLVYNLQFTHLADLTSDATAAMATDSTAVFIPPRHQWETVGALDATTHARTMRRTNRIVPPLLEPDTVTKLTPLPPDAMYVALPNGDPEAGLKVLADWYEIGPPRRFERAGYSLDAYRLTLRDGRARP